jgi:hypothetical protein
MRRRPPPASSRRARGLRAARSAVLAAILTGLAVLAAFSALGYGDQSSHRRAPRRAHIVLARSATPRPVPLAVFLNPRRSGRQVPSGFLGLSFEVARLPQLGRYAGKGNLVTLLRSLGPGVLRFGGVTADTRVAWTDTSTPVPPWAAGLLSSADLHALAKLAAASSWRVLLTVGMGHFDPAAAAREAAAARSALGGMLAGIELGNEPDAYGRHDLRERPWTFSQYAAQAQVYVSAFAQASQSSKSIPLAGPDVSGSAVFGGWGAGEAEQLSPTLLTGHHYPLGCHEAPAPTIARLLSVETRIREDVSLERYMRVARAAGIGFRMDETNSVSCGGTTGISDTFASALWAVSYIARGMAAGVAGINFHGDPANCRGYAPLCAPSAERLEKGVLSVRPEWYALLLAKQLIGDRGIGTRLRAAPGDARPNVSVTGLRAPDGRVHVVVVDEEPPGSAPVLLHVHAGHGYSRAQILALTAPSPSADSGVELGGRKVQPDGSFKQAQTLPTVAKHGGLIAVKVRPSSALLLTLR